MARNTRPTAAKREREKALIERRQQKEARRRDPIKDRPDGGGHPEGIDPDIAGIVPGFMIGFGLMIYCYLFGPPGMRRSRLPFR